MASQNTEACPTKHEECFAEKDSSPVVRGLALGLTRNQINIFGVIKELGKGGRN